MVSLSGLNDLLAQQSWTIIECDSVLDFWEGLISFEDVYDLILETELSSYDNPKGITDSEIKLQTDKVLKQLTKRFFHACPLAKKPEHLRQPPALVVLPAGNSTGIAGIVFKADHAGATYICFRTRYLKFWKMWFELQDEKINETIKLDWNKRTDS
ncbi:MAG: hypothetical protein WCD53_11375 [Microcoleus sp.]